MKSLLLLAALSLPASAALATPAVPVPNPRSPKARMVPAAEQAAGTETLLAKGADGARAVVCGAAVVTAVLGARLEAACADPAAEEPSSIRLIAGGFHVHVGSAKLRFDLGGTLVEVRATELIAVKLKDQWIVQIKPLGETMEALVVIPAPPAEPPVDPPIADPPDPDAAAEPAAPPPQPTTVALAPGKRFSLAPGAEPQEASRRESLFLGKLIARLLPEPADQSARGPRLAARNVERQTDFAVDAIAASTGVGDVEIEDIEVEVGCVEICVD